MNALLVPLPSSRAVTEMLLDLSKPDNASFVLALPLLLLLQETSTSAQITSGNANAYAFAIALATFLCLVKAVIQPYY